MAEGSLSLSSQNLLARLVVPVLGCMLALVLGTFLVSDRENTLSTFMNIVGIVGFFLGAISPRLGIFFLVFLCAYLDFAKRLMILFGEVSMEDVIYVLRVAPFALVGVLVGLIISYAFRRFQLKRLDWILISVILFIEVGLIALTIYNGNGITDVANTGVYVPMILVVSLVFQTVDELLKFCRIVLMAFLPVALYGIWQGVFGLADFEYQYLVSGLTITSGALDEVQLRPFSTLNSPHAFEIAMGICVLLAVMLSNKNLRSRAGLWNSSARFVLPAVFLLASIIGLGRTGWCVWIFGGIGFFAFTTPRRTIVYYSSILAAFVLLVANAQLIYDNLENIQKALPSGSDFSDRAFTVGSYSERLFGYINVFTNRELLTWFGNPTLQTAANGASEDRNEIVHDALGQILVNYGLIGLTISIVLGCTFLYWAHSSALRLVSPRTRAFTVALLSIIMGVVVSGMLGGGSVGLFPINFIFWSIIGSMIAIARSREEAEQAQLVPGIVRLGYQRSIASRVANGELAHPA